MHDRDLDLVRPLTRRRTSPAGVTNQTTMETLVRQVFLQRRAKGSPCAFASLGRLEPSLPFCDLLADVHQAVFHFDQGTGPALDAVDGRIGIPIGITET